MGCRSHPAGDTCNVWRYFWSHNPRAVGLLLTFPQCMGQPTQSTVPDPRTVCHHSVPTTGLGEHGHLLPPTPLLSFFYLSSFPFSLFFFSKTRHLHLEHWWYVLYQACLKREKRLCSSFTLEKIVCAAMSLVAGSNFVLLQASGKWNFLLGACTPTGWFKAMEVECWCVGGRMGHHGLEVNLAYTHLCNTLTQRPVL